MNINIASDFCYYKHKKNLTFLSLFSMKLLS